MIAAPNTRDELAWDIRAARHNGLARGEVRKCLLPLAVMGGRWAGSESFRFTRQALLAMGVRARKD